MSKVKKSIAAELRQKYIANICLCKYWKWYNATGKNMKTLLFSAWTLTCFALIVSGLNNVLMYLNREKWDSEDRAAWEALYKKANREPGKLIKVGAVLLFISIIVGYLFFIRFET